MSFSRIKLKQIESGQLYGFFNERFVTGEVVRPYQTGDFTTRDELINFETLISGQMANVSGLLYQSGDFLSTGVIQLTGRTLFDALEATGRTAWSRDDSLSGSMNQTGLNLINLITGLSGAFNNTGWNLYQNILVISGGLEASGQANYATLTGLSGAFDRTGLNLVNLITGLSGAFDRTGLNLVNTINSLSGTFDITGWNLLDRTNALSGTLLASGVVVGNLIQSISGTLNQSGLNIVNLITGLSGAFDRTGWNLSVNIANLSGSMIMSGAALRNDLDVLTANLTTLNSLSGNIFLTGVGSIQSYRSGTNYIIFSGQSGASSPAKVVSVNNLTGNVFVTGTGNIIVHTIGSGIYVSGNFITTTDTGNFATTQNLNLTGQTLLARDTGISGYLKGLITGSLAGVSSINGFTGIVNFVAGTGVSISGSSNQLFISLSGSNLPSWIENSPDVFTPTTFEDDFDAPNLHPRWTGINVNVDSSGINNSHFWLNAKAAASSTGRNTFMQGVTTGVDWEIMMKFNGLPKFINFNGFGLCIGNASTNRNTTLGYEYNSANYLVIRHSTGWNAASSLSAEGSTTGFFQGFRNMYFRLRSRDKNMTFDTSNEGIVWRPHRNWIYTGYAPSIDQVGFYVNPNGTQVGIAVDYFRVTGVS